MSFIAMSRSLCLGCILVADAAFGQLPSGDHKPSSPPSPYVWGAGRISGRIETADGKPVSQAAVAVRVRPTSPGRSVIPFNAVVLTDAKGVFAIQGVPDGKFAVCPSAPGTKLLEPCLWTSEPTVTVRDGETASLTIRMTEGADLYVRIKDPSGMKVASEGKTPGASLLIGVRRPEGEGLPIPMTAASDGSGYHIIAPPDTLLVVKAFSPYFALSNASGKSGSPQNGLEEAVTMESNASKEVVFTISGLISR